MMNAEQPKLRVKEASILVIAAETVGGRRLIEAVEERAKKGPIRCALVCPENSTQRGFVVYGETVRDAAQVRLEIMLRQLQAAGIACEGQTMDSDPYLAATDAIRIWEPDEIIISTYAYNHSGFWRRDLVDRIRNFARIPVEHVSIDMEHEEVERVLVVANQTVGGQALVTVLEQRASEEPRAFTIVMPQSGADRETVREAKRRLARTLEGLERAGVEVAGQIIQADPVTAVKHALQFYPAERIVVSTLPELSSKWLRGDVVDQIGRATGIPVEHIVVDLDGEDSKIEAGTA